MSSLSLVIKLMISSRSTHFSARRHRIECLTSESEIEGTFKRSEEVRRALFGITTEERKLTIECERAAKNLTIQ
jgi:hypothetical protein